MFANTIDIDLGDAGSPDIVTLIRQEEGAGQSQYSLTTDERIVTMFIRHSAEKNKVYGQDMIRHQVLVRVETAPTEIFSQGRLFESYLIMRTPRMSSGVPATGPAFGVATWSLENLEPVSQGVR